MQMLGFQANAQIFDRARNFTSNLVAIIPDFHLKRPQTATVWKALYEKYQVNGSHKNEGSTSQVEIGNYCHIFIQELEGGREIPVRAAPRNESQSNGAPAPRTKAGATARGLKLASLCSAGASLPAAGAHFNS